MKSHVDAEQAARLLRSLKPSERRALVAALARALLENEQIESAWQALQRGKR